MDKDRVIGSAKVTKGKVKEAVGKAIGDAKLEIEGKADKIEGEVQNAVGGVKDALRGEYFSESGRDAPAERRKASESSIPPWWRLKGRTQ